MTLMLSSASLPLAGLCWLLWTEEEKQQSSVIQKEGGRCRRVSQKADKTQELLKAGSEDGQ